jgi:hypothetical protein
VPDNITCPRSIERKESDGLHIECTKAIDVPGSPSTEDFDAVFITHGDGTGLNSAKGLPVCLRSRTMILWPEDRPGDEEPNRCIGCSHFGPQTMFMRDTPLQDFLTAVSLGSEEAHA